MTRKLPIKIQEALKHLDKGVEMLRGAGAKNAPNLKFTLDGRLIGDIGELLAALVPERDMEQSPTASALGTRYRIWECPLKGGWKP
jgi:hypothetical protein